MADTPNKGTSKRRVSFLMPYIDFCFMLIIIFIGMLSIAYFEPLGLTDIQTEATPIINDREGEFDKKPVGIQQMNTGAGEKDPSSDITPLIAGSGQDAAEAQVADLQRELAAKKAEIERLKKLESRVKTLEAELKRLRELEKLVQQKENELASLQELQKVMGERDDALERLRQLQAELETARAELERLKKMKVAGGDASQLKEDGAGNHVYIDLRKDD